MKINNDRFSGTPFGQNDGVQENNNERQMVRIERDKLLNIAKQFQDVTAALAFILGTHPEDLTRDDIERFINK